LNSHLPYPDTKAKSSDNSFDTLTNTEKDEKYWTRRMKNNLSAKKSRDARRIKESQYALTASILEIENKKLLKKLEEIQRENESLKQRLSKYVEGYNIFPSNK
jgi:hypothetical protein